MNLGYDVNSSNEGKIFYDVDGFWRQSANKGALMIRPVFAEELPQKIDQSIHGNIELCLYPNPADQYIYIDTEDDWQHDITYKIFSMHGKQVMSNTYVPRKPINISGLSNGLYIIVFTGKDIPVISKKFIVNH